MNRRPRSGVILIQNQKIALIQRKRDNKEYWVIPGGNAEPGETLENAAVREAREDLGIEVDIIRLLAVVHYKNQVQYYYLAHPVSGRLGEGQGEEMSGQYSPDRGTYRAEWISLADLDRLPGYPQSLFKLFALEPIENWPINLPPIHDTGGIEL